MKSSMTEHAKLGITISHARFSQYTAPDGTGYMAIEKQL